MARVRSTLQNHQIPIKDVTSDHGNSANAYRECVPSRRESDAANVHRDAALRLRLASLRKSGGDRAQDGNVHDAAAQFSQRGDHPERPRFTGIRGEITFLSQESDVAGYCIQTAKTKVIGDFLIGWGAAMLPSMTFNEVGQRPLFGSEWLHTVWIYTIIIYAYVNEFCLKCKATGRTSVFQVPGVKLTRAGITNIAVSRSAAARRTVGSGFLSATDRSPRGLCDARCYRVGALCGESQKPTAAAGTLSCGQPRSDGASPSSVVEAGGSD